MKYQSWDLKPVGQKWCRLTNLPEIFDHFFATPAHDNVYLWNETSHRQTKMLVSVYNVYPKS